MSERRWTQMADRRALLAALVILLLLGAIELSLAQSEPEPERPALPAVPAVLTGEDLRIALEESGIREWRWQYQDVVWDRVMALSQRAEAAEQRRAADQLERIADHLAAEPATSQPAAEPPTARELEAIEGVGPVLGERIATWLRQR